MSVIFLAGSLLMSSAFVDHHELPTSEQFVAACEAYQVEHGGVTDCQCLADAASEDHAIMAGLIAISSPEDVAAASDEVKAVLGACQPAAAE